jgi:hypothetical protein
LKLNLAVIFLIAVLTMVSLSSGLGVEGVIFDAEVTPGQHISHEIKVKLGQNEAPMDLRVNVEDWGQSQEGVNYAMANGSNPYSARSFLKVYPSNFRLEPGQSQSVMVEGDVPLEVGSGGRYALVTIYGLPLDSADEGQESSVGLAVAVTSLIRIVISSTELEKSGKVESLKVEEPLMPEARSVSLIFNNTGNCHFKALARCSLIGDGGAVLAESSSPLSSNIIPGASRIFRLDLAAESPLKGELRTIDVTVETEDGTILDQREFEV